ncbi:MAG TPA: hypothetical protein VMU47_06820 [Caldimonas sp.]|nr:hypothetical protein [Caldimonas sp.]
MGKASPALVGFSAGEFAPWMEARLDEAKYPVAAHVMQNFWALKQGPAQFRSGSAYAQQVKNSANRTWVRRFEYSQTEAYVLEFGDFYVRFYTNHGPLLAQGTAAYNGATAYVLGNLVVQGGITYYCLAPTTGNAPPNSTYWYPLTSYTGPGGGAIYEIPSPYAAAQLTDNLGEFTLQFEQSADVLYIAAGLANGNVGVGQGGYPPYTLTRYGTNPPNWQFAQYAPVDGPFSDTPVANLMPGSGAAIALGVSAVQGQGITITAYGGPVFAATDVGRLVRIDSQIFNVAPWATQVAVTAGQQYSNNGNNYTALNSATTGASPPVHTSGAVQDGPTGVWWLYTDSGYGIAQVTGYTDAQHVTANVLKRFPANVVGASATITGITRANPAVVSCANSFTLGEALFITGVNGMTQVNQAVPAYCNGAVNGASATLAGVDSTTYGAWTSGGTITGNVSCEWQLGAWSATTEWPHAVAFFKDRLFWGGDINVWGSVPGQYTSHTQDFFGQQTTDSAINEPISGLDASGITWLSSAIILLIGTRGGEYGLDAANYATGPLGPDNVEILRQSQWRCRAVRPELCGTTVLYVQRSGRKTFAMDYTLWLNRYDSTDQQKYAFHATIGGLTAIALQQEPYSMLWGLRADGTLLSYTFNREDNVTAWCRHNLGGNGIVESITVIPSPDGLRDELWLVVNRTVNGAVVRTVEYLTKPYEGPQGGYAGDQQNSCWYVDCGLQAVAAAGTAVTGVSIQRTGAPGHITSTVTVYAANSFTAGQTAYIAGVVSTGTFNVNGAWPIASANASSFTITPGPIGSFAYVSGGTVTANAPDTGSTVISGIPSALWNQTVAIFADGGKQPQQVVSGTGTLTIPGTFSVVTFGFPYQGNLVPMRFESQAVGIVGTTQGKSKRMADLVLRLVDTLGGVVGQLSDTSASTGVYTNPLGQTTITLQASEPIMENNPATGLDNPPPIRSGDFLVDFKQGGVSDSDDRDLYTVIQQNDPCPMTVVGVFPRYVVSEPASGS